MTNPAARTTDREKTAMRWLGATAPEARRFLREIDTLDPLRAEVTEAEVQDAMEGYQSDPRAWVRDTLTAFLAARGAVASAGEAEASRDGAADIFNIPLDYITAALDAQWGSRVWAANDYHARRRSAVEPLDMLLWCPVCHHQHIDAPEPGWDDPPHKSHLCANCGLVWRPADIETNGVAMIQTRGSRDTWATETPPVSPDLDLPEARTVEQRLATMEELWSDVDERLKLLEARPRGPRRRRRCYGVLQL